MAVPTKFQSGTEVMTGGNYAGGGQSYIIETMLGVNYKVFIDLLTSDPSFCKSLDGGLTWSAPVALKDCVGTQIAVWYDRWSNIDGDLIHVAYTDSTSDDTFYRNINTASSDSLSTEYTIFAGASASAGGAGGALAIARMRGGNLVVAGCIDVGTEIFTKKSTDVGVNWSDIATGYEAAGNADLCIMMPGWGADNQDAMMFYYDRSATEISVKYYDDSANSWSETSIATTISLPDHTTTTLGHMNAAVDLANSQNLLVFWTAVDAANADLRCFKVTQSAQTETTSNVVLNSTDDQGFCGITIDGTNWYVIYAGLSDGSQTYATRIKLYYKLSTDGGATWGSETEINPNYQNMFALFSKPIQYRYFEMGYMATNISLYIYISSLSIPHTNYQIGI